MHIARRKNAVYIGALQVVNADIALFVHRNDVGKELRVRDVPDEDEHTVDWKKFRLVRFDVFEFRTRDLLGITANFFNDGIPDEPDFVVFEGAFLHNLARSELVPAVDDVYLGSIFGEEDAFLNGCVPAADDDEPLVLEEKPIAGGAVRDTPASVFFFTGDIYVRGEAPVQMMTALA